MRLTNFKKLYMKLTNKAILVKMPVEVALISIFTYTQALVHIFAERNLLSLKAWKESLVDLD